MEEELKMPGEYLLLYMLYVMAALMVAWRQCSISGFSIEFTFVETLKIYKMIIVNNLNIQMNLFYV